MWRVIYGSNSLQLLWLPDKSCRLTPTSNKESKGPRSPKYHEDHLGAFPGLCTFAIKELTLLVDLSPGFLKTRKRKRIEPNHHSSIQVAERTLRSIAQVISCHIDGDRLWTKVSDVLDRDVAGQTDRSDWPASYFLSRSNHNLEVKC